MRIFFIEGPDNTGKTTVVNELFNWLCTNQCNNINIMHCEKPEGDTIEEQISFQNEAYEKLARQLVEWNETHEYDAVIFDRCWYGEYVYGTMYRKRDKQEVIDRIHEYENILLSSFKPFDLHLILLTTEYPEFLVKNDDGKSISNANIDLIKKELKLFDEIFNESLIGKDPIETASGNRDMPLELKVNRKVRVIVTRDTWVEVEAGDDITNLKSYDVKFEDGVVYKKTQTGEFKSKSMIFSEIYEKLMLRMRLFS